MNLEKLKDRIIDLENQQKEILRRIKHNSMTVDQIIEYGSDLNRLKIRISELNAMTWV